MYRIIAMLMLWPVLFTVPCLGLEREVSLVTGEAMGELAVAGRLAIDLYAEFMVSRTYGNETALNWYNCGFSGGGKHTEVGGNFGDFGLHVPAHERDDKYPNATTIGDVPAVTFDGNDIMKGNFAVEETAVGSEDMALEVWLHDPNPSGDEVLLGWQSPEGASSSAPLKYPPIMAGTNLPRHIVVNCTADREIWYLDGQMLGSYERTMLISVGHYMVLGGATAGTPSYEGSLIAVRLHEEAMTEEEIAHNFSGGAMLGTEMHSWWRTEDPEVWWSQESEHFRHCVERQEMEEWSEEERADFMARLPEMFEMAESIYHTYSERMALRSSVVSVLPELRGDGIRYKTPIQPSEGSWMGWDGRFGWACQGAGHINPHELVHGWQGMTGGTMQGNYWEAHANFPQTYNGIYQTIPPTTCSRVCMFFPANGRDYYHARLMFEHLAQSEEYGPMFISKLWYDGGAEENVREYPWTTFTRFDPDASTPLAYEWMRMVQRCITWDFRTFSEEDENLYASDAKRNQAELMRYARVTLQAIPYAEGWWRPPKEMVPQQLAYNICPVQSESNRVSVELAGYVSRERGSDWRVSFVGVDANGEPRYSDIVGATEELSFEVRDAGELYLIVCATPTKVMPINMTGDFRSLEQEKFPYRVKLTGASPLDVMLPREPTVAGSIHRNGGGFVADTARVDANAYVGSNARVLGDAKVLGQARIEGYAVVDGATVRDRAVVSDHARVDSGAIVQDDAKVRNWGWVREGATLREYAKVLEHGVQARKTCGGFATIKGVAYSFGNVRGTAMVDGSYAKSNAIDKGKWFTWSWGAGQNPGEIDEEFGGIYMRMLFEEPHQWMARDDFGVTWGYLVGDPIFAVDEALAEYVDTFDEVMEATTFSVPGPVDLYNDYGAHLFGYLLPPVTGDYVFWIYSDDTGELWLSADITLEHAQKVAWTDGVTGMNNWTEFPGQKSKPVHLEAGRAYYIEGFMKEAGGGDFMAAAWEYPGQERIVIDGKHLSRTPDGPRGAIDCRIWRDIEGDEVADLVDNPRFSRGPRRIQGGVLALNGRDQFVELQDDVADMRDTSIQLRVRPDNTENARFIEYANDREDRLSLGLEGGKLTFTLHRDDQTQTMTGPTLQPVVWADVLVVLSENTGTLFVDGTEVARNDQMTLNPEQIRATECYLGRGHNGHFFEGQIDSLEIYSVAIRDEIPPIPDPARFTMVPTAVNPEATFMQAVTGTDSLGSVEYFFEETSGQPGGDDSGWISAPFYLDSGLSEDKAYSYRLKMRDIHGNETAFSETVSVGWAAAKVYTSADGKTLVIEAEHAIRSIPGSAEAADLRWGADMGPLAVPGTEMVAVWPDVGVQIDNDFISNSPRLDYLVDFPAAGRYAIWVRARGANPAGDSVHLGLDMQTSERMRHVQVDSGKLQWTKQRDWVFEIQQRGIHTFSIWMREDGCALDRLVLTNDLQLEPPEGSGPAESQWR